MSRIDFAISYAQTDQAWAEWVAWTLEEANYSVLLQAWDFPAGSNFVIEMQVMLSDATRTIGILSPSYLASSYALAEFASALRKDPGGHNRGFVPVRVAPFEDKGLLASIVYIDLFQVDEDKARERLLAGVVVERRETKPVFPGGLTPPFPGLSTNKSQLVSNLSIPRLPVPSDPELFVGRDHVLDHLSRLFRDPNELVVQLVGDGGVGKSTITWHWLESIRHSEEIQSSQLFEWSFYSQGQHQQAMDSSLCLEAAIQHFRRAGIMQQQSGRTEDQKAEAIARSFGATGGVIVLDGIEPLQYPPNQEEGRLKDDGLIAFLRHLRVVRFLDRRKPSLVVLSTRWPVPPANVGRVTAIPIDPLDVSDACLMLRSFHLPDAPTAQLYCPDAQLPQADAEFRLAAQEFGLHPLALVLLASYLIRRFGGDITKRRHIGQLTIGSNDDPYRHANRVMKSYDRMFAKESVGELARACRRTLHILGLFYKPIRVEYMEALLDGPVIRGVTDGMSSELLYNALSELRRLRLVSWVEDSKTVSAHPLIREHFAKALNDRLPSSKRAAHGRLFEWLRERSDPSPLSLARMDPLFEAVHHGCQGARFRDAFHLLLHRIIQTDRSFGTNQLGGYAQVLTALSGFFEADSWRLRESAGAQSLLDEEKLQVLGQTALCLRATKGYSYSDLERIHSQAITYYKKVGDQQQLLEVEWAQWVYFLLRGDLRRSRERARRCWQYGKELPSTDSFAVACLAVGFNLFYAGRITFCQRFLEAAVNTVPSQQGDGSRWLFAGQEPRVACRARLSHVCWMKGDAKRARQEIQSALAAARTINHPFTLVAALSFGAWTYQFLNEPARVKELSSEAVALSTENHFPHWLAQSLVLRG